MSRPKLVPADFNNVLDVIDAVNAVPRASLVVIGNFFTGASVANIVLSYQALFPAGTLTPGDLADLLLRGARSGVFNVACPGATSPDASTCESPPFSDPLYMVNQNMVKRNPLNKVYAAAINAPVVASPGILEVGYATELVNPCTTLFTSSNAGLVGNMV